MQLPKQLIRILSIATLLLTAIINPAYAQEGPDDGWDEQQWCADEGGTWNADGWCDFPDDGWDDDWIPEDDGSVWSAPDEVTCLERGGIWESDDDWGWCYEEWIPEDDGSVWSAPDEVTCLERGGIWESDDDWGWCYQDSGEVWDARDEVTCLERGGICLLYTSPSPRD